jgi:hypothetical protein
LLRPIAGRHIQRLESIKGAKPEQHQDCRQYSFSEKKLHYSLPIGSFIIAVPGQFQYQINEFILGRGFARIYLDMRKSATENQSSFL